VSLRLFIAADLPAEVRGALPAPPDPPWRPVPAANLHVTLAFLGAMGEETVPALSSIIDAVCAVVAAPRLRVLQTVVLPPRRPRVLAVELDDPSDGLGRLQAALSAALASQQLYVPEKRRFLAHVTIGRARGPVGREDAFVDVEPLEFAVPSVTLYRSTTAAGGARYEPLHSVATA
jgi:RNA 2',3'-cyclic 3'-phosphodiesterase